MKKTAMILSVALTSSIAQAHTSTVYSCRQSSMNGMSETFRISSNGETAHVPGTSLTVSIGDFNCLVPSIERGDSRCQPGYKGLTIASIDQTSPVISMMIPNGQKKLFASMIDMKMKSVSILSCQAQ